MSGRGTVDINDRRSIMAFLLVLLAFFMVAGQVVYLTKTRGIPTADPKPYYVFGAAYSGIFLLESVLHFHVIYVLFWLGVLIYNCYMLSSQKKSLE